jgi:hypothetical protein
MANQDIELTQIVPPPEYQQIWFSSQGGRPIIKWQYFDKIYQYGFEWLQLDRILDMCDGLNIDVASDNFIKHFSITHNSKGCAWLNFYTDIRQQHRREQFEINCLCCDDCLHWVADCHIKN